MEKYGFSFVTLTHANNAGTIAVRADMVIMIECCGSEGTIVSLGNGDSFMCKESVEEVLTALNNALN